MQCRCGYFQNVFAIESHQLLSHTALVQGVILLAFGPAVDHFMTGEWIGHWTLNIPTLQASNTGNFTHFAL